MRTNYENFQRDYLRSLRLTWPKPDSRDYAALSDCGLYAEVLQVASSEETITAAKLMSADEGLRQRLRRLHLVQNPTKTNITALLSALQAFNWLQKETADRFSLTREGQALARDSTHNIRLFRRKLAEKLQKRYVTPGWFVARLHDWNPQGQGEVVLPAPPKSGKAERRLWSKNAWPIDFDEIVVQSADTANRVFPGSFPIEPKRWLDAVHSSWERLGAGLPPKNRKASAEHEATFSPRERLFHAMREAAVGLLFGAVSRSGTTEFSTQKPPISARAFRAWCPRLDELEFIFYTDYHPDVPGRIIVPCSAFRNAATTPPFEAIQGITDPQLRTLWLFQPLWDDLSNVFVEVLEDSYRRTSKRVGAIYVSLLNVRDEVCRQLRISSTRFDFFLESAYRQTIKQESALSRPISISLESDIRPDQLGAVGLNRRPVFINNVPHSLISIATVRSTPLT